MSRIWFAAVNAHARGAVAALQGTGSRYAASQIVGAVRDPGAS